MRHAPRLRKSRTAPMRAVLELEPPAQSLLPAKVKIDFPKDGESIGPSGYTFRLDAGPALAVELSVDGSAWHRCREAAGLWWYDWSGYQAGEHCAVARVLGQHGELARSGMRRFSSR